MAGDEAVDVVCEEGGGGGGLVRGGASGCERGSGWVGWRGVVCEGGLG